jgi:alkanesulfonate monooxygenase SsuD/methylene tetrahydromethanopterin reductase-like flavin-dependent oxidoreductase (luciferase family)
VKVGVFLKLIDQEGRRTKRVEQVVRAAVQAEELGFDSIWVMDHLFTDAPGVRVAAHDPLQLLAAVAANTRLVSLGTLVLCGPFRLPVQLAREAMTLSEASGGRFICGLGAGWNQPEFDATGIPFDHLVSRLERQVAEYLRLLGQPGLVPPGNPPPLWIAGGGPRMLRLIARIAAGWNAAWYGGDPAPWSELAGKLRGELRAAGRDESSMTFSAGISALIVKGEEARRYQALSPDAPCVCGPAEEVAAALRRYQEAGCDHAILSFSPTPYFDFDEVMLARAGEVLTLLA